MIWISSDCDPLRQSFPDQTKAARFPMASGPWSADAAVLLFFRLKKVRNGLISKETFIGLVNLLIQFFNGFVRHCL